MNYHIYKNGQQSGPFSEEQIRQMVSSGFVMQSDLCWRTGLSGWMPVSQVLGTGSSSYASAPPPVQVYQMQTGPDQMPARPFAGFWIRCGAYIVDGIILQIGMAFVGGFIGGAIGASGGDKDTVQGVCIIAAIGCSWLYYALSESGVAQATFGKRVCGLMVADVNGGRISFGQASGRYFGMMLSGLTLGIGFLMCAWTERKQCLHDMMSSCVVLKKS